MFKLIYHSTIYGMQYISCLSHKQSVSCLCHAHTLAQKHAQNAFNKGNNKFVHFLPVCGTGWQKGYFFCILPDNVCRNLNCKICNTAKKHTQRQRERGRQRERELWEPRRGRSWGWFPICCGPTLMSIASLGSWEKSRLLWLGQGISQRDPSLLLSFPSSLFATMFVYGNRLTGI